MLAAWPRSPRLLALAGLVLAAPLALAQQEKLGLRVTLDPSPSPTFVNPAASKRLDLTLQSNRLPAPAGRLSLFAGRTLGREAPDTPGLAPLDPDVRSTSDLMYVGVQFEGGARLRLKRWGNGVKFSYRANF